MALNSPVRIAGVEVGKVISTSRDGNATKVTFTVEEAGRPIHDDAFAAIRPRIFLEGNFFVDLDPGSPSAPDLDSGATIPISHTSTAVQIDEVLTALQSPVRADLSRLLESYGTALTHKPTAAEDANQLPEVRGKTGAEALNGALKYGGDAGRYSAQVTNAFLGTQQRDLSRLVAGAGRTFGAFASRESDLQGLIDNFNVFTGALAAQSTNLSTTIHLLAPTVRSPPLLAGQPQPHAAAAAHLRDRADPRRGRAAGPDQRLQTVARPGPAAALRQGGRRRRQAAGRIDPGPRRRRAGGQWKSPCRSSTGSASARPRSWSRPATRRSNDRFSTGGPNYREFLYNLVNFAGFAQNYDGNGPYRPGPGRRRPLLVGEPNPEGNPANLQRRDQLRPHDRADPIGNQPQLGRHAAAEARSALRHEPGPERQRPASGRSVRPPLGGGGEPVSEPDAEGQPLDAISGPGSRASPAATARTRSRSSSWRSPGSR